MNWCENECIQWLEKKNQKVNNLNRCVEKNLLHNLRRIVFGFKIKHLKII